MILMNRKKNIHSIRFGSIIDIQVRASTHRSTLFKFQWKSGHPNNIFTALHKFSAYLGQQRLHGGQKRHQCRFQRQHGRPEQEAAQQRIVERHQLHNGSHLMLMLDAWRWSKYAWECRACVRLRTDRLLKCRACARHRIGADPSCLVAAVGVSLAVKQTIAAAFVYRSARVTRLVVYSLQIVITLV